MTERATPRLALTSVEWRLYVVAALAGIYLIAWRAIAGTATPGSTEVAATATPPAAAPRGVWIDEIPLAQRPALAIPPGWELVPRGDATIEPAPRVARVPASRPLRVRTRSS